MSGPKGYAPQILERQRRELERAANRRAWARVADQVAALAADCTAAGLDLDVWRELDEKGFGRSRVDRPTDADVDAVDAFARAAEQVATLAQERRVDRAAGRALESLAHVQAALDDHAGRLVAATHGAAPADRDGQAVAAATRLTRLLASTGAQEGELTEQLRDLLAEEQVGERRWLALAGRIAAAVSAERDRGDRLRLSRELSVLAARVEGPIRDHLLARIEAAGTSSSLEALRPVIERAVDDAARAAQRDYILSTAVAVWSELGYQATADFAEVAAGGRPALLTHPAWPAHALQVRFDPVGHRISTNLVATADSDEASDRETEQAHCAQVPAFTARMAEKGVEASHHRRHRGAAEHQ